MGGPLPGPRSPPRAPHITSLPVPCSEEDAPCAAHRVECRTAPFTPARLHRGEAVIRSRSEEPSCSLWGGGGGGRRRRRALLRALTRSPGTPPPFPPSVTLPLSPSLSLPARRGWSAAHAPTSGNRRIALFTQRPSSRLRVPAELVLPSTPRSLLFSLHPVLRWPYRGSQLAAHRSAEHVHTRGGFTWESSALALSSRPPPPLLLLLFLLLFLRRRAHRAALHPLSLKRRRTHRITRMGFYGTLKMIFYKVSRASCHLSPAACARSSMPGSRCRPHYLWRASRGRSCGHCGGWSAAAAHSRAPRDAAREVPGPLCCVGLALRKMLSYRDALLASPSLARNFSHVQKTPRFRGNLCLCIRLVAFCIVNMCVISALSTPEFRVWGWHDPNFFFFFLP